MQRVKLATRSGDINPKVLPVTYLVGKTSDGKGAIDFVGHARGRLRGRSETRGVGTNDGEPTEGSKFGTPRALGRTELYRGFDTDSRTFVRVWTITSHLGQGFSLCDCKCASVIQEFYFLSNSKQPLPHVGGITLSAVKARVLSLDFPEQKQELQLAPFYCNGGVCQEKLGDFFGFSPPPENSI